MPHFYSIGWDLRYAAVARVHFFTGCSLVSKTMIDRQLRLLEFNNYLVQIHILDL
jgi:hypothetical protein